MELKCLVVAVLVACSCLCIHLGSAQDVYFINVTDLCLSDTRYVPSDVDYSSVTNNSAVIHWDSVTSIPPDVQGYQILYWPLSSSIYETQSVGLTRDGQKYSTTIQGLRPYTNYAVVVRMYCGSESRFGMSSPLVTFTTDPTEPSAAVTNVSATQVNRDPVANISWTPLAAEHWNGIPFGYAIYVFEYSLESNCGGSAIRSSFVRVGRNTTSDTLSLHNYCYRVNVFAINHKAWGPGSDSLYFKYSTQDSPMFALLSDDEVPRPTSESPESRTPFVKTAYFYIIAFAVVAVVPVVIGIVFFKKAKERKRKVQYCRSIHEGGIQLDPLSPSSGSSAHFSPHPTNSRMQGFSPLSDPSPVTPSRPLLSSPMPPQGEFPREATNHLFAVPPIHSPTSPNFPQSTISPGFEGGSVGRSFTLGMTASDVFGGTKSGPPGMGPHRPRAHTESDMNLPNPYEHPVHPGGAVTLPRTDFGTNSGNPGGSIPPPPSHAPPPLTQSSLEIFARAERSPPAHMNGHHNLRQSGVERHQRHGISHRSFSTTHAAGLPSPPPGTSHSMRIIRSASHLHPVDEQQQGGPDYAVIDPDPKVSTLDRHPPPRRLHMSPGHPPAAYLPNGTARSTRKASDDLSSYSDMTNDSTHLSKQSESGGVYRVTEPRESVFSETSTEEQSISSGSIREASPNGANSWMGGAVDGYDGKRRRLSSSATPTNSRASNTQLYNPPLSPS